MYNINPTIKSGRILNENEFSNTTYEFILSTLNDEDMSPGYYIINPEKFFKHKGEHLSGMKQPDKFIPKNILNLIKENKCKLIVDLSYEATGLYCDELKKLENGRNSHVADIYTAFNDYCTKHNIVNNTVFISMMEEASVFKDRFFPDGKLHVWDTSVVTLRYKQFNYDKYKHLLNVPGEEKNAIWLNRRLREHRVNLVAECVNRNIDFDKMHFSFIGSRFEKYEVADKDHDLNVIRNCGLVDEKNFDAVASHLDKTVGLDLDSDPILMDQWLAESKIGRVVEMLKVRSNSVYEIVTEFTHNDYGVHFSEKITLPILSKKPFVLCGDRRALTQLKKLGFKTFDKFWDESYDVEYDHDDTGNYTRTKRIAETIDYIEQTFHDPKYYTRDEYGNVIYCEEMQEILEHNYNHYHDVYYPSIFQKWASNFSCKSDPSLKIGKHPVEVYQNVEDDNQWEDAVWYNQKTHSIFIPIWRNGNSFFQSDIAENEGYRLIKKNELADISTVDALCFVRNPEKRIIGQLWRAIQNSGVTPDDLKNTDDWASLDQHLTPQYKFIEGLNVVKYVDLDAPIPIDDHDMLNIDKDTIYKINDVVYHLNKRGTNRNESKPDQRKKLSQLIKSDWFQEKFHKIYKKDFELFFKNADWKFRQTQGESLEVYINQFFNNDDNKNKINDFIKTLDPENIHLQYLKSSISNYWTNHGRMFEAIGMSMAPKNIKILDIGTHFGIIPWMLKERGFTNVYSTNSSDEYGNDTENTLPRLWNHLGLDFPYDLNIKPMVEFELPEKYDVILITKSNIFWVLDKVYRYRGGEVSRDWQIKGDDGIINTFFTMYDKTQYDFFENNIKKYLNTGGVAIVQPDPFMYNKFPEAWSEELKWFKERQQKGYTNGLVGTELYPDKELTDYFVIVNDGKYK